MMKFKHGTRRRAAEYEKDWVQRWKDDQTFERSVAQRPADNAYVFYDGPPPPARANSGIISSTNMYQL